MTPLTKTLPRTYYISQGKNLEEHLLHIKNVCEAGCQLVQLRLKGADEGTHVLAAQQALAICEEHGAKLIINDHVMVALQSGAHGVHLGQGDMSPLKARSILPEGSIIGGTANTMEECEKLIAKKVDYIGLGPFRFTQTKKHLSPLLSLIDYHTMRSFVDEKDPNTPIYAIGGVVKEDVAYLYEEGIHGVAMSGALSTNNHVALSQIISYCESFDSNEISTN